MSRPFPMGEYWAVRENGKLLVFWNDRDAYEYWEEHA